MAVTTSGAEDHVPHGGAYDDWLSNIHATFGFASKKESIFTTDIRGLYTTFLQSLPPYERQYHDCHACRSFINTYGGLVTINDRGEQQSAIWSATSVPSIYAPAVANMRQRIQVAPVTGVFYTDQNVLGHPRTGNWTHFAVPVLIDSTVRSASLTQTAFQRAAEKLEDYRTLTSYLRYCRLADLQRAVTLLQSEVLYRSEKVLGMAEWLLEQKKIEAAAGLSYTRQINLLWKAVATAPAGFCHPKTSMIGSLLDDIASGSTTSTVARRFREKMNPAQYQRPQAAPAAGNIAQAEKLIEQLKAAGSLERRFATLEDVRHRALWLPATPYFVEGRVRTSMGVGIFSQVTPKTSAPVSLPPISGEIQVMGPVTWDKFARVVLPKVRWMQIQAPAHGPYAGLATALHTLAPPIIQWDTYEERNPVSWYLYHGGSDARQWNLVPGSWHDVDIVILAPNMWYGHYEHQGKGVLFGIPKAHDAQYKVAGLSLFPEILKSEFHGIRATIEAYSHSKCLEGQPDQALCGVMLQSANTSWNINVCVRIENTMFQYTLERWD